MSGVKVKIDSIDAWIQHLCKFELLPPFKANVLEYRVKQQEIVSLSKHLWTLLYVFGSPSYFPAEDPLTQDSNQSNTLKFPTSR